MIIEISNYYCNCGSNYYCHLVHSFCIFINTPQNIDDSDKKLLRDEIVWQKLQKTYLEHECREKYMGQLDKMEACFDRANEEQIFNLPDEFVH